MSDPALDAAREDMLHRQLRRRGIHDQRVLDAMAKAPRERFVPEDLRDQAYADQALPIRCSQTISQPYMVALMTQALEVSGEERVLEVGTGSGYQTAILAALAKEVISVERHAELSFQAGVVLGELGCKNVVLLTGDGARGGPDYAPFDRIIVTAAAPGIPPALFQQLTEGGILVIPVGEFDAQWLQAVRKVSGEPAVANLIPCRFVPLVSTRSPPC